MSLLLGSTGEGTASAGKEKQVLQILTENGCFDPLESHESLEPVNDTEAFSTIDANADDVSTELDDLEIAAAPAEAADITSTAYASCPSRKRPLIVNKDPSEFVLAIYPRSTVSLETEGAAIAATSAQSASAVPPLPSSPSPSPSPTKRRTTRKSQTTEDVTANGSNCGSAPSAIAVSAQSVAEVTQSPTKRRTTRQRKTTETKEATVDSINCSNASPTTTAAQFAIPTISLAAESAAAAAVATNTSVQSTSTVASSPAPAKRCTCKSSAAKAKDSTASASTASFKGLLEFYNWLQDKHLVNAHYGIEQIISICSLNPDYYQKVTNGILPYLSALTSGELSGLLSSSEQSLPSFLELIKNNKIFYAALHCLKDGETGQALGKLLISDLAFVAGELNAKADTNHHRVSVFIDEAAELANESLVQLLNKARASNFAITLATQCVADLSRRAGSHEAATQIIANCNNLISLRVNDPQSASVIASVLPQTVIVERSSTQSCSEGLALNDSYATSRTLMQRQSPLFPSDMLMKLPDFEFIARHC